MCLWEEPRKMDLYLPSLLTPIPSSMTQYFAHLNLNYEFHPTCLNWLTCVSWYTWLGYMILKMCFSSHKVNQQEKVSDSESSIPTPTEHSILVLSTELDPYKRPAELIQCNQQMWALPPELSTINYFLSPPYLTVLSDNCGQYSFFPQIFFWGFLINERHLGKGGTQCRELCNLSAIS